jgi:2-polyprenyl-3-methyl-5-hydroxy-6-metoxy-1,4-benzoquinol methylase
MSISNTGFWNFGGQHLKNEHCIDPILSKAIVQSLHQKNVREVYDFGCGLGNYTLDINQSGIQCTGFDGNPETSKFPNCIVKDLTKPMNLEPVDCVLCLEVAEHIPKQFEESLLKNITTSIKDNGVLILSWAVEGQGGLGHVNCQNNPYVIDTMKRYQFI